MNFMLIYVNLTLLMGLIKSLILFEWEWNVKLLFDLIPFLLSLVPTLISLFVFLESPRSRGKMLVYNFLKLIFMDRFPDFVEGCCVYNEIRFFGFKVSNWLFCDCFRELPLEFREGSLLSFDSGEKDIQNIYKPINISDDELKAVEYIEMIKGLKFFITTDNIESIYGEKIRDPIDDKPILDIRENVGHNFVVGSKNVHFFMCDIMSMLEETQGFEFKLQYSRFESKYYNNEYIKKKYLIYYSIGERIYVLRSLQINDGVLETEWNEYIMMNGGYMRGVKVMKHGAEGRTLQWFVKKILDGFGEKFEIKNVIDRSIAHNLNSLGSKGKLTIIAEKDEYIDKLIYNVGFLNFSLDEFGCKQINTNLKHKRRTKVCSIKYKDGIKQFLKLRYVLRGLSLDDFKGVIEPTLPFRRRGFDIYHLMKPLEILENSHKILFKKSLPPGRYLFEGENEEANDKEEIENSIRMEFDNIVKDTQMRVLGPKNNGIFESILSKYFGSCDSKIKFSLLSYPSSKNIHSKYGKILGNYRLKRCLRDLSYFFPLINYGGVSGTDTSIKISKSTVESCKEAEFLHTGVGVTNFKEVISKLSVKDKKMKRLTELNSEKGILKENIKKFLDVDQGKAIGLKKSLKKVVSRIDEVSREIRRNCWKSQEYKNALIGKWSIKNEMKRNIDENLKESVLNIFKMESSSKNAIKAGIICEASLKIRSIKYENRIEKIRGKTEEKERKKEGEKKEGKGKKDKPVEDRERMSRIEFLRKGKSVLEKVMDRKEKIVKILSGNCPIRKNYYEVLKSLREDGDKEDLKKSCGSQRVISRKVESLKEIMGKSEEILKNLEIMNKEKERKRREENERRREKEEKEKEKEKERREEKRKEEKRDKDERGENERKRREEEERVKEEMGEKKKKGKTRYKQETGDVIDKKREERRLKKIKEEEERKEEKGEERRKEKREDNSTFVEEILNAWEKHNNNNNDEKEELKSVNLEKDKKELAEAVQFLEQRESELQTKKFIIIPKLERLGRTIGRTIDNPKNSKKINETRIKIVEEQQKLDEIERDIKDVLSNKKQVKFLLNYSGRN